MKLYFLVALLSFSACHKAPENLFYSESLSPDESFLEGRIQYFRSLNNLSGINSKEYYELKAWFFQDSSYLELISHAGDRYLKDGIRIRIERQAQDLRVKLKIHNFPYQDLFVKKDYFLNSSEIDWTFELHNGIYEGFRVQVWDNLLNIKELSKKKIQHLGDRNLIFDSLDEDLSFVEQAYGLKWGVKAYKTEMLSVKRTFNKK